MLAGWLAMLDGMLAHLLASLLDSLWGSPALQLTFLHQQPQADM